MVEDDKEELGDAIKLFNRGLDAHIERNLDRALEFFQKALPTFQEFGAEEMVAGTFHEIGMIYQEKGDYDTALENYQKSLHLSEGLGYNTGIAKTLYQMGTLYEETGNHLMAKELHTKAERQRTRKPSGLNFIIVTFLITGLWGIASGLFWMSGLAEGFTPDFLKPEVWASIVHWMTLLAPFFLVLGSIAFTAGLGLWRLKGWGWVLGIFTSLLLAISITGILFYWYLAKDSIQELYDVKG